MSTYEVVTFQINYISIFRGPTRNDFTVERVRKFKTKKRAGEYIKACNLVVETVDAPYMPIEMYRIQSGKRKLIWEQKWSRD